MISWVGGAPGGGGDRFSMVDARYRDFLLVWPAKLLRRLVV